MRRIAPLTPFLMVAAGLYILAGAGAALAVTGGLMWLDCVLPERGS